MFEYMQIYLSKYRKNINKENCKSKRTKMDLDEIHNLFLSEAKTTNNNNKELVKWIIQYSENFLCPICKSVFKQTVGLKDCMHKFCEICIKTSINGRNRACPICQTSVKTVRHICRDYQFDSVKQDFFTFWYNQLKKEDVELIENAHLVLNPHPFSKDSEMFSLSTNARATGMFVI